MKDTLRDKIVYAYWSLVPYEYRPREVWYKFKCWAWKRYTTVKPRYLPHTWTDRCALMPHMMFEILCEFVENECGEDGHIEWYGEHGHRMVEAYSRDTLLGSLTNHNTYVMEEMLELVHWWKEIYNKEYQEVSDLIWAEANKHAAIEDFQEIEGTEMYTWDPIYKTEEDKEIHNRCLKALNKLDKLFEEDLNERLHRIIPLIPSMWT